MMGYCFSYVCYCFQNTDLYHEGFLIDSLLSVSSSPSLLDSVSRLLPQTTGLVGLAVSKNPQEVSQRGLSGWG